MKLKTIALSFCRALKFLTLREKHLISRLLNNNFGTRVLCKYEARSRYKGYIKYVKKFKRVILYNRRLFNQVWTRSQLRTSSTYPGKNLECCTLRVILQKLNLFFRCDSACKTSQVYRSTKLKYYECRRHQK